MNKFTKALTAAMLGAAMMGTSVQALPSTAEIQSKIETTQNSLKEVKERREEVEQQIEGLDNSIMNLMDTIDKNQGDIEELQKSIKNKEIALNKAIEEEKAAKNKYYERMAAIYKTNNSTLDIIFSSKNLGDLVERIIVTEKISESTRGIIQELKDKQTEIKNTEKQLTEENDKLIKIKKDNETKLQAVNAKKAESDKLVAELKAQEAQYGSQIDDSKELLAQVQAEIKKTQEEKAAREAAAAAAAKAAQEKAAANAAREAAAKKSAQKQVQQKAEQSTAETPKTTPAAAKQESTSTTPSSSITQADTTSTTPAASKSTVDSMDIVSYAMNFIGTPYVWGGTTPSGFDCSGFTQYVYRHFGIYIGRTTYNQINNGHEVSRSQIQPGDLILFGTPGDPEHVGIYVGNNSYIHAPHTGDYVKISSLSAASNRIVAIRRIL